MTTPIYKMKSTRRRRAIIEQLHASTRRSDRVTVVYRYPNSEFRHHATFVACGITTSLSGDRQELVVRRATDPADRFITISFNRLIRIDPAAETSS
jgi:hypothetical protein